MIFPLYVMTTDPIPFGQWLDAKEGPITADGKVKSKLGPLCFRPGWHLSDIPLAIHIGQKENGVIKYMHDDEVWCECEYSDQIDYQSEANAKGLRGDKIIPVKAMLAHIPKDGFYHYKTSPLMLGQWIIAGSLKVNRILSDDEVESICKAAGHQALPHKRPLLLSEYGF